ncbi:MAG: hypothetical protein ACRDF0_01345 [Candidatus Limnocylindria bacterium]
MPGKAPTQHVYLLTEIAVCPCGAQVTAASKGYMRCRAAAQHRGCTAPGVRAEVLETQFSAWSGEALQMTREIEQAARAAIERRSSVRPDAAAAERIRRAMAQLSKQHQWELLDDESFRIRMRELQQELARLEQQQPQAQKAAGGAAAARVLRADLAERVVREASGVRAALLREDRDRGWLDHEGETEAGASAASGRARRTHTSATQRSRPGSDPQHRTLVHGVLVGGLEELMELLAAGAA